MLYRIILLVIIFRTCSGGICCRDGWIRHRNSCYLFQPDYLTWMEANKACTEQGAALASIETADENRFVQGYLENFLDIGARMGSWIGGNRMVVNGEWTWFPSRKMMNFSDWQPGQPDHEYEECLIMWPSFNFKWADIDCNTRTSYLCEEHALTEDTDPVKRDSSNVSQPSLNSTKYLMLQPEDCCRDGWMRFGHSCYLFEMSKETWTDAYEICAGHRASLVNIETVEENESIRGLLQLYSNYGADDATWIGGNDMQVEGTWRWLPSEKKMSYTDWYPGEPSNRGNSTNEDCLCLWPKYNFHWNDDECHSMHCFMCEERVAPNLLIG